MKLHAVVACLIMMSLVCPALAGPQIEFVDTTFSVGNVYDGQVTTGSFEFKNAGDEDLEIAGVHVSCDCTVTKTVATKLAPGESSKIEVVFTAFSPLGDFEKSVTVRSNDPDNPNFDLKIRGQVVPVATISPERLNLETIAVGGRKKFDITVTPNVGAGFKITKTESRQGHVKALKIKKAKDDQGSYKIRLAVQAGDTPGRLLDRLIIHTDLPGNPVIGFLVSGDVVAR